MSQLLNPPERATQKVILHDTSWETYERLLAEHGESTGTRFTYDRGTLEIMSPSLKHERLNDVIADSFKAVADEMGVDFVGAGSTTFRREDLDRGFEPDSCFYIANADRVRDQDEIDLDRDPPPDLVIEVDITSPSLPRFPIFAAVGVPEVWRYDGARLRIFRLAGDGYGPAEESAALRGVPGDVLSAFVEASKGTKRAAWLRGVREWARQYRG
jgi:Uma2 family endonuclease